MTEAWHDWRNALKLASFWPKENFAHAIRRTSGKDRKALEAGCGIGSNMLAMLWRGFDVYGVDVSYESLRMARMRLEAEVFSFSRIVGGREGWLPNWEVTQASVTNLPFPDECFDLVVSTSVVQHLTEAERLRAMREMGRVLAPSGKSYMTFMRSAHKGDPHPTEADTVYRNQGELLHWFAEDEVRGLMAGAGLEVEDLFSTRPAPKRSHGWVALGQKPDDGDER
jgi:ubiquinone/menaquinone biosynthesis C-methylase UbiE